MRRGRDYLLLSFRPRSGGGGGTALVVGSNLPPVFGSYVPGFGLVIGFPLAPSTCICGRARAYAARKRRWTFKAPIVAVLPPTLTRRPARPRISATTSGLLRQCGLRPTHPGDHLSPAGGLRPDHPYARRRPALNRPRHHLRQDEERPATEVTGSLTPTGTVVLRRCACPVRRLAPLLDGVRLMHVALDPSGCTPEARRQPPIMPITAKALQ